MSALSSLNGNIRWNDQGLLPVVVQHAATGDVLMLAWADEQALARTIETRRATYWSRSRQQYWVKGETSGNIQQIRQIKLDCDFDTILYLVDQIGPACHTGTTTCFNTDLFAME